MFVVVFRAKIRAFDADYLETAARLRDTALRDHGCLGFYSAQEGKAEIAVSYWPDETSIRAWKKQADHVLAQAAGADRWYESYSVDVAQVTRAYGHERS